MRAAELGPRTFCTLIGCQRARQHLGMTVARDCRYQARRGGAGWPRLVVDCLRARVRRGLGRAWAAPPPRGLDTDRRRGCIQCRRRRRRGWVGGHRRRCSSDVAAVLYPRTLCCRRHVAWLPSLAQVLAVSSLHARPDWPSSLIVILFAVSSSYRDLMYTSASFM